MRSHALGECIGDEEGFAAGAQAELATLHATRLDDGGREEMQIYHAPAPAVASTPIRSPACPFALPATSALSQKPCGRMSCSRVPEDMPPPVPQRGMGMRAH